MKDLCVTYKHYSHCWVCVWGSMVVCATVHRHTLIHIPLLDFHPFLNIWRHEGVLYRDRGGDSIYYNLLEPLGLTASYFILMYHHSLPHILPRLTVARKTSEKRNNNGKAGDWVFTFSLTLALSEASISQQIKLPKLDCAPAGRSQTSPGTWRGTMGFCCSGDCGNNPCWAGHYVSCCAGWVGPTVLLCIYGFCSMMRPIEPFMTEFLTGAYKNLTIEQVRYWAMKWDMWLLYADGSLRLLDLRSFCFSMHRTNK